MHGSDYIILFQKRATQWDLWGRRHDEVLTIGSHGLVGLLYVAQLLLVPYTGVHLFCNYSGPSPNLL